MAPYFISFLLSAFLLYIAYNQKQVQSLRTILVIIALLIPCVLAGIRDTTIGTDVKFYVEPMYHAALKSENYNEYSTYMIHGYRRVKDYEVGFTFLVYAVTKLFGNINVLLFFIQLLIIVPLYYSFSRFKDLRKYLWLMFIIYYFMFFNVGLNIMRQYISIAFSFLGLAYLLNDDEKKYLKFVAYIIVGSLFHSSSLLGIIVLPIYDFLYTKKTSKKVLVIGDFKCKVASLFMVIFIIFGFVALFNLKFLSGILYGSSFSRYAFYIDGVVDKDDFNIMYILPLLIILVYNFRLLVNNSKLGRFYALMFIVGYIILEPIGNAIKYGGRVSSLFDFFNCITFPTIVSIQDNKRKRNLCAACIVAFIVVYWGYRFIYHGYNQTYPFIPYWR